MGTILGGFMAVLDIQITNAYLKDIQAALGATLEEGSWISTAYLVAEIVVIPMTGWLAQVFSFRRYILVNAALFTFFSMSCAWAWDLNSMIVFRALQDDAKYGRFDRNCSFGNFGNAARAIPLESVGGICFIIQPRNAGKNRSHDSVFCKSRLRFERGKRAGN
jgi:MFS family permease